MIKLVLIVATVSTLYAGMAGLCLSMERHYKQLFEKAPDAAKQRLLRWAGWLLLALSFWYSLGAWGNTMGPVAWFGALTAVTGVLVVLVSYRGRTAFTLAAVSLALSLLCPVYLASH